MLVHEVELWTLIDAWRRQPDGLRYADALERFVHLAKQRQQQWVTRGTRGRDEQGRFCRTPPRPGAA